MCHDPSQPYGGGFALRPLTRPSGAVDGPSAGHRLDRSVERAKRIVPLLFAVGREPFQVPVPRRQLLRRGLSPASKYFKNSFRMGVTRHHDPIDLPHLYYCARRRIVFSETRLRVPYSLFAPSRREARFTTSPIMV